MIEDIRGNANKVKNGERGLENKIQSKVMNAMIDKKGRKVESIKIKKKNC